ncbi:hypothetical protein [Haloquadratum walsbyi]|uniref:hypothetical protein n=1 Tax=Haloquadratum walsbyi TaxID=293091 RepID=UPI00064FE987|nr:hypothetical protein [Haloquadratum walsbyi]
MRRTELFETSTDSTILFTEQPGLVRTQSTAAFCLFEKIHGVSILMSTSPSRIALVRTKTTALVFLDHGTPDNGLSNRVPSNTNTSECVDGYVSVRIASEKFL